MGVRNRSLVIEMHPTRATTPPSEILRAPDTGVPLFSFTELSLLPSLEESLSQQGIHRPTDIQVKTLPPLLEGKSLVGLAETGSGKTLSYVLPMLHQLKTLENAGSSVSRPGSPRGLVLVPSRELGEQVSKVFKTFTHNTRLRVRVALGGSKKRVARNNVAGKLEILVATPGTLEKLLDTQDLHLEDVRMLVFDEADQILDPGFLPVAERIIEACPRHVQLVLFSATLPVKQYPVVDAIFPKESLRIRTDRSQKLVETLVTDNRNVVHGRRFDLLRKLLEEDPDVGTILFVNTRDQGDTVAEWLSDHDYTFVNYRGEMDRALRRQNLARFREGEVALLLTTDLGGRGLDIERVDRVINVHLPNQFENYLHRVGRTARAGRSGLVVNLVTERDAPLMAKLERLS